MSARIPKAAADYAARIPANPNTGVAWVEVFPSEGTKEVGSAGDIVTDNGDGTFVIADVASRAGSAGTFFILEDLQPNKVYSLATYLPTRYAESAAVGWAIIDENHAGGNPEALFEVLDLATPQFAIYDYNGTLVSGGVSLVDAGLAGAVVQVATDGSGRWRSLTARGLSASGSMTLDEGAGGDYNQTPGGTGKLALFFGKFSTTGGPSDLHARFQMRVDDNLSW